MSNLSRSPSGKPAARPSRPAAPSPRTEPGNRPARPIHPAIEPFLSHLATERGLADNSLLAYRRDLVDLSDFLVNRGVDLNRAAADDFRQYLQSQTRKGQSTRTVARRLAAIRVFLRYCAMFGRDTAPILQQLDRPKLEHSLPKVLNRAQVNELIAAPDPESTLFSRDVAILELLYASGLRATELCELKLRDTNLSVGALRVFGKGAKERVVPLGRAAREAVERYLAECRPKLAKSPSDLLFLSRTGKPLDRVGLWYLVEKYGRKSGLLKRISPHTLRHCFATHLIGGGADLRIVQELLGHSDVGTTQIYTHVDADRLRSIHKKFHPRG